MLELPPKDQRFFDDRENWGFGPIFFLELFFIESYRAEQMSVVLHQFPGLFPWEKSPHGFDRLILSRPTELSHSVGLGHIVLPHLLSCEFFIYPSQFARVCDCECWQLKRKGTDLGQFQQLMKILIELARQCAKHLKIRGASISSEDWRFDDPAPNRIFILTEYARLAGITDFERESEWVISIPLQT